MSDNRDWQADIILLRKIPHSFADLENILYNIAPYWMHEAEKWRVEAFKQHPTQDAYDAACAALQKHRERANEAEAREQKLKELVSEVLGDTDSLYYLNPEKTQRLVEGFASIYPKEAAE